MNPNPAKKQNCWEAMGCERGPGGKKVGELGVCCAATAEDLNGINNGDNGGRICWAVAGTLCDGHIQGTFAVKIMTCVKCPFFQQVKLEEGVFSFQFDLLEEEKEKVKK